MNPKDIGQAALWAVSKRAGTQAGNAGAAAEWFKMTTKDNEKFSHLTSKNIKEFFENGAGLSQGTIEDLAQFLEYKRPADMVEAWQQNKATSSHVVAAKKRQKPSHYVERRVPSEKPSDPLQPTSPEMKIALKRHVAGRKTLLIPNASYAEIAKIMEVEPATIHVMLSRENYRIKEKYFPALAKLCGYESPEALAKDIREKAAATKGVDFKSR